jgi:predicted NUDIX family NTP pyrophosphohydrolase
MYRRAADTVEVLLVHPGGPVWKAREAGAWSIPKGVIEDTEEPLDAARREFTEETGLVPQEPYLPLGTIVQRSGKVVHAWAFAGELAPGVVGRHTFRMEWPPRSGVWVEFPEIDRAEFFPLPIALERVNPAQRALLERLATLLAEQARRG